VHCEEAGDPFLEDTEKLKNLFKPYDLAAILCTYSHILDINKSSLHTRRFWLIQVSVLIYRLTEKWLCRPEKFPAGLSRNGP